MSTYRASNKVLKTRIQVQVCNGDRTCTLAEDGHLDRYQSESLTHEHGLTFSGSPPNALMWSFTHCKPTSWSLSPRFTALRVSASVP